MHPFPYHSRRRRTANQSPMSGGWLLEGDGGNLPFHYSPPPLSPNRSVFVRHPSFFSFWATTSKKNHHPRYLLNFIRPAQAFLGIFKPEKKILKLHQAIGVDGLTHSENKWSKTTENVAWYRHIIESQGTLKLN